MVFSSLHLIPASPELSIAQWKVSVTASGSLMSRTAKGRC